MSTWKNTMMNAVLWDNDGVLVDTEHLYFRATREVLSSVGVDLTRDLFIEISLRQGQSAFDLAVEKGLSQEVIGRIRAERNQRYSELIRAGVRVMDGVDFTLRRLYGKVSMGIVTGSLKEHFEIIHAKTGILQFFEFVLTREGYGRPKPHPDPFLAALKRQGLRREHCMIVEDSERGLAAAKAAGIPCIVVPNEFTRGGNFSGAYGVYKSVRQAGSELLNLLS